LSLAFPSSEYVILKDSVTLLQGTDSLNVIDRIVSTKISNIINLGRREVLFCDFNGRICDIGTVFPIFDNFLLVSSSIEGSTTRRSLVDGKSWDENCEVLIADDAITRISIFPDDTSELLSKFDIECPNLVDNEIFEVDNILISHYVSSNGYMVDILVPPDSISKITSILSELGYVEIDSERWSFVRIMLGLPTISDAKGNLPEEMGMDKLVSNDKGCYPGQEVHARIESRGRTVKSFCRLIGKSPILVGKYQVPEIGSIKVTSSTFIDGTCHALALVKLTNNELGKIHINGHDYSVDTITYP